LTCVGLGVGESVGWGDWKMGGVQFVSIGGWEMGGVQFVSIGGLCRPVITCWVWYPFGWGGVHPTHPNRHVWGQLGQPYYRTKP